jgi:acetyltransferase-like isoleucine patch superfamily enzyme
MLKSLINNVIHKLGKKDYKVDESIKTSILMSIVLGRLICLLRGQLVKLKLKQSDGFLFIGRRTKLKVPEYMIFGRSITIEDGVEINALSKKGIIIGNNVTIKKNSIIECTGVIKELGEGLKIGNNVGIAQNAFIQVRGFVEIGSNVMFGPGVSIFSENHIITDPYKQIIEQGATREGVIIEDNVWVGANSTILDGVRIGTGSVIAAGSVVTKNVEQYSVVGGVPAILIKMRK